MALTLKILSLTCVLPVAWSLTQEVAGLSPFNDKYFLSLNSLNSVLNSVKTFRKNSIVLVGGGANIAFEQI